MWKPPWRSISLSTKSFLWFQPIQSNPPSVLYVYLVPRISQSPAWEKFELYINSTSLRLMLLFSFYLDSKGLAHSFPCCSILLILTPALLDWSPICLALSPSVTYGAFLKELHAIFLNVPVQNQPKIKSIIIIWSEQNIWLLIVNFPKVNLLF